MAKKKDDNGKKGGKKKPVYNAKKKYDALNHRLDNYTGAVDALYESLEEDMANIALRTGHHTLQEASMFRLASYPAAFQSFKKLVSTYLADLSFIIGRGTEMEWQRAETDHDNMVKDIMAQYGGKVPTRKLEGYLTHKTDAAEAFLSQQRDGKHGWSARVWNLTDQIQDEMELSVSAAVADGTSASTLAAQMKKYLNEPDRLFRRVRNEYGELELSKNAAAYHPGPGIYRSSRANAMRLCRSEINRAYRNADQERYQSEDFVVGYEINLSGSHPEHDICDILKGKYPKNFQWSGWHPNDLCFITPILKTEEDFFSLEDTTPKNQVDDVPEAYKKYLEDNAERLEAARQRGTLPFWVKDNYQIGKNGGYRPLFGPDAGPRSVVSETKSASTGNSTIAEKVTRTNDSIAVPLEDIRPQLLTAPKRYNSESNKSYAEYLESTGEYTRVKYFGSSGGVYANHRLHGHNNSDNNRYFKGFRGPEDPGVKNDFLERRCATKLAKEGHRVELLPEGHMKRPNGEDMSALDMKLNGRKVDIATITDPNKNIKNAIDSKNKQLGRYFKDTGYKGDTICLYFHDPTYYDEDRMYKGFEDFRKNMTRAGAVNRVKKVICVFGDDTPTKVFKI